jgi:hypothetical protein
LFYSADKIYRAALNLGSTAIQASYVFTISNKRDWILMVDYQRAAGRVGCSPREVIGERRLSYRLANGALLERADLIDTFKLLNDVEKRLIKKTRREVKDAVLAEQIIIEIESLGIKEAA